MQFGPKNAKLNTTWKTSSRHEEEVGWCCCSWNKAKKSPTISWEGNEAVKKRTPVMAALTWMHATRTEWKGKWQHETTAQDRELGCLWRCVGRRDFWNFDVKLYKIFVRPWLRLFFLKVKQLWLWLKLFKASDFTDFNSCNNFHTKLLRNNQLRLELRLQLRHQLQLQILI